MKYKLIAFDLDGTFLRNDKTVPEENLAAMAAAAERGLHIVPATGRILCGVPQEIRQLPFVRYWLTVNGAYVYDAVEDRPLYSEEIDSGTAIRAFEYMDTVRGCIYDCYQDNFGYMTQSMYDSAEDYVSNRGILQLIRSLRTTVPELKEYLRQNGRPLQKLQMYFSDMDERARQLKALPELFPEFAVSSSVANNIEINSARANKGQALAALCRSLGISPSECIAFGDGTNDLSMIRTAGCGVAMANADDALKAEADVIAESNESCGVAGTVRTLLGI